MTREDPQMKLRLPTDLKDRLTQLATESGRSVNAEVVKRLEDSLNADGQLNRAPGIDDRTLDLFAEKVSQVLDKRDKRPQKPETRG